MRSATFGLQGVWLVSRRHSLRNRPFCNGERSTGSMGVSSHHASPDVVGLRHTEVMGHLRGSKRVAGHGGVAPQTRRGQPRPRAQAHLEPILGEKCRISYVFCRLPGCLVPVFDDFAHAIRNESLRLNHDVRHHAKGTSISGTPRGIRRRVDPVNREATTARGRRLCTPQLSRNSLDESASRSRVYA